MKKLLLITLGFILSFLYISTYAACDQTFENNFVRYDSSYRFYDTYSNPGSTRHYINNVFVDYVNPNFLDSGGPFALTNQLRNSNFTINGGQTMEIISTTSPGWRIARHPNSRTNATVGNFDFMISYKINYDFSNNYPNSSDDLYHTECQYFSVTWCGDGTKDASESCDFNDTTHTGWGAGGCNASCLPVSGGGGGGGSSCGDGTKDASESCDFNDTTHTGWGAGGCNASCLPVSGGGGGGGSSCGDGTKDASESCDFNDTTHTGWGAGGCNASCLPVSGGGGGGGPSGGVTTNPGINSYCGDLVVERPNASGQYEQCDTTESWCQNCQYTSTQPSERSGRIIMTKTNPGVFSPVSLSSYKIIAGDGVNIFSKDDTIKFDGGGNNIYLGGLPVKMVNNSDTILTGNDIQYTLPSIGVGTVFFKDHDVFDGSGNLIDIVYNKTNFPNTITLFDGSSLYGYGFKGKPINTIYSDTRTPVIPSLSPTNTFFVSIGYLEENLPIRISKSAVSNTSGGNAYLFKPAGYDLGFINNGDYIENLKKGNFTVASINDTANLVRLSSLTTNIVDENIQDKIKTSASGSKENINSLSQKPFVSAFYNNIFSMSDFDSLDKLGDNENIRISREGVNINGILNLTGKKTIVIENGDLIINKDIKYTGNTSSWAFIVKNGNIIISKNVSQISGVFMALNGEVKSDGDKISKQLIVDGSLYGDSGDLVKNRTYIRATTGYSAITTGVIINYSSRILKNPPPLLLNYINQFNLDRVAK